MNSMARRMFEQAPEHRLTGRGLAARDVLRAVLEVGGDRSDGLSVIL